MSANDRQIGGDHYKKGGEEHWDRQWRLYGRGYFVGCITKYVERYHEKNGLQDLEKAKHFLDKLIELESAQDQYLEVPKSASFTGYAVNT
jgi:hypothetical protein